MLDSEAMWTPQVGPVSFHSGKQPSRGRVLKNWLILLAVAAFCVGVVGVPFWAAFEFRLMGILWMVTGVASLVWAVALIGKWIRQGRVQLRDLRSSKAVILNAAFVVLGSMEFVRAGVRFLSSGTGGEAVLLWGAVALFVWGLLAVGVTTFQRG